MRNFGWLLVCGFLLIGLAITSWVGWSYYKLRQFRISEARLKSIQESQRGKRPLWPVESRNERNGQR